MSLSAPDILDPRVWKDLWLCHLYTILAFPLSKQSQL